MSNQLEKILDLYEVIEKTSFTEWKVRNKLLKEVLRQTSKLLKDLKNPTDLLLKIIASNIPEAALNAAWELRIYEPEVAREVYVKFADSDPMASLLLKNWENDQLGIEDKFKGVISEYKNLKEKL